MKDETRTFISSFWRSLFHVFRDVWLVWLVLASLSAIPYIVAKLRTPAGHVFTGVLTAYDDTFTYLAWMRQGVDGHMLLCDLFTSEPQSCEFFLPLWTALGFVSRFSGIPIAATFHLARLLAAFMLLVVARIVAGAVIRSRTRLRYSLWMYSMSGGLGWLAYVLTSGNNLFKAEGASGSVDLNMPEATAFRSVFAQVHFSVGVVLVAGAIRLFYGALVENKASRALVAGALVSLLAVVHPYMVVVVGAVAAVAAAARPWLGGGRQTPGADHFGVARAAAALGVASLPGIAYLVYLNRSNDVLREWLRITDTLSPAPWEYLLGFGIVGLFAPVGFRFMWTRRPLYGRLLLIWCLVQAALLYAPLSFQRRLVEGLQLPLSIAASIGVFAIANRMFQHRSSARTRRWVLAAVVVVASITNLGFIAGHLIGKGMGASDPRRYLSIDVAEALEWLRVNATSDSILFSSYLTGNIAPSRTGLRVLLGHYGQTINSDRKGEQVTAFYSNKMSDETARQMIAENHVSYVIYGPFERTISNGFYPPGWLTLVYRTGDVEIFRVQSF